MTDLTILADRLYDGVTPAFQDRMAVVVRDGRIAELRPATAGDEGGLRADIVSPGMIDIQINGAGDAQFNFAPSVETLACIAHGARQGGTAHILPTFITAHGTAYLDALNAARQAIAAGTPGILGIHLEGPFLSPVRPGIHDATAIRPLSDADVDNLTREAADFPGPILLTLAPECQDPAHLARLDEAGIVVFAGHSEAPAETLTHIRGATHLWNAMPGPSSRAPGIASEVLGGDRLYAGLIADGHHVGTHALQMSLRAAPARICLVTDAMLTLAGKSQGFNLDGKQITLSDGKLTGEDGTLAGAHIAMDESLQKLIELTGADPVLALQTASLNPARALGVDLGRIAPGAEASLSLFDAALNATGVVTAGQYFPRD